MYPEQEIDKAIRNLLSEDSSYILLTEGSGKRLLSGEAEFVIPHIKRMLYWEQPFRVFHGRNYMDSRDSSDKFPDFVNQDVIKEAKRIVESTSYVICEMGATKKMLAKPLFEGTGILFLNSLGHVWFSEPLYQPTLQQVLDQTDNMIRATGDFHHIFLEEVQLVNTTVERLPDEAKYPDLPHYRLSMGS